MGQEAKDDLDSMFDALEISPADAEGEPNAQNDLKDGADGVHAADDLGLHPETVPMQAAALSQAPDADPVVRTPAPPPLKAVGLGRPRRHFDEVFAPEQKPLSAPRGGLEAKVEYLREKLKRAEGLQNRFRQAWDTQQASLETLEKQVEQQGHALAKREEAVASAEQTAETLRREIDGLTHKIRGLEDEQALVAKRYETQIQRLSEEHRYEKQGLQLQAEQANVELEEVKAALATKSDGLTALQDEHHRQAMQFQSGEAEFRQRLEEAEQAALHHQEQFEHQLQTERAAKDELAHSLQVRDEAIEQLKQSLAAEQSVGGERTAELESARQQYKALHAQTHQEVESLQAQLQSLNTQLEEGRRQTDEVVSAYEQLQTRFDEAQQKRDGFEKELELARETEHDLETELSRLAGLLQEKNAIIERQEGTLTSLQQRLQQTEQQHQGAMQELEQSKHGQQHALETAQQNIQVLQERLTQSEASVSELRADLQQQAQRQSHLLQSVDRRLRDAKRMLEHSLIDAEAIQGFEEAPLNPN